MASPIVIVLLVVIVLTVGAITGFFVVTVFRRINARRRYQRLDRERKVFREAVARVLAAPDLRLDEIRVSPREKIRWQALEDVLLDLIPKEEYRERVKEIFRQLGYIAYYENRLKRRSVIDRAAAIDRLGGMRSEASVEHLIRMLDSKNSELVSGAVRAITRIRSMEGLRAILGRLPALRASNLIAQKLVEASLAKLGRDGAPVLLQHARGSEDPEMVALVLEVISNFEFPEALPFVIDRLRDGNPEVRAKAAKAFGKVDPRRAGLQAELLLPMLEDPVWYVRLQAAKTLGSMKHTPARAGVGRLLLDDKWQVRGTAATALVSIGEGVIDIFWQILKQNDRYANESICEEIGKTELIRRLIDNLAVPAAADHQKSREVLETMVSLRFTAQLEEAMASDPRPHVRSELARLLEGPPAKTPSERA